MNDSSLHDDVINNHVTALNTEDVDGDGRYNLPGNQSPSATLEPALAVLQVTLQYVEMYLLPVVMFVGVIGNTLSFVVFVSTHLRRHRCNVYLASLALVDNAFLVCVFISWSDRIGVNVYHRRGACQLLVYLTHVTNFLSVWYVVAFTVERYVVLRLPFQHRRLNSNTRSAKVIVISLALLSLIAYSFTVFTSDVTEFVDMRPLCAPLPDYGTALSVLTNADTLLVLVVPTTIVLACNVRIAYIVWAFYHTNRMHGGTAPRASSPPQRRWNFSETSGADLGRGGCPRSIHHAQYFSVGSVTVLRSPAAQPKTRGSQTEGRRSLAGGNGGAGGQQRESSGSAGVGSGTPKTPGDCRLPSSKFLDVDSGGAGGSATAAALMQQRSMSTLHYGNRSSIICTAAPVTGGHVRTALLRQRNSATLGGGRTDNDVPFPTEGGVSAPISSFSQGVSLAHRTTRMRATRLLLIVSTVFLCCHLPSYVTRTYLSVRTLVDDTYRPSDVFIICQQFFQIVYYVNFAVNFFLYSLSGRTFRRGMTQLWTRVRRCCVDRCIGCCVHEQDISPLT